MSRTTPRDGMTSPKTAETRLLSPSTGAYAFEAVPQISMLARTMAHEDAFIAEFTLSSPEIRDEASFIPEVELDMVDLYLGRNDRIQGIFWVDAPDDDAFEESLSESNLIGDWELLVDRPGRKLYNLTVAQGGALSRPVDRSREYNVVWQQTRVQEGALRIRAIVPDRKALTGFHQAIREDGYEFSLHQVTSDIESGLAGEPSLSKRQREALILAYERGYYEQPRQVSLAEIGEELGISESAVSGRLLRGISQLLEDTLPVDENRDEADGPS